MSLDMIAAAVIVVVLVLVRIRVVADNQRFAVLSAGRFSRLKGPGLVFVMPGFGSRWVRIKVGDQGTLTGKGLATINRANVPVAIDVRAAVGKRVRVTGFGEDKVLVAAEG